MKIKKLEQFSEGDLVQRLREITMLKAPDIKIYDNTFISLEKLNVEQLAPPQNYILRSELTKVRELKWALQEYGIDIFQLDGFVRMWLDEDSEPVDILPPVVEESIEKDGSIHFIICDGMHRVYMALREWVMPQVVLIRGIPKDLPYYAFPVPRGWERVEERDDIPAGYLKKWHRIENYHALYRNFNSSFTNVGGPRKRFTQSPD